MDVIELVPILQASVGPFVLISGIGLLLLSMTNRFARPVDLIRRLLSEMDATQDPDHRRIIERQIGVFRKRCSLLRTAIALALVAITCACCVTFTLFAELIFGIGLAPITAALFAACLGSLIASLWFLMRDLRITLTSIDLEVQRHTRVDD